MAGNDMSELTQLVADLRSAPDRVVSEVVEAIEETGEAVRDDWQELASAANPAHAKKYSKTIFARMDYSLKRTVTAIIRPRRGGQGNLGEVLERGTRLSRAQWSNRKAVARNEPGLLKRIEKAAGDTL